MTTQINSADDNFFQYVNSIIRGKGEINYYPDGTMIYPSLVYLTNPLLAIDIFTERYNNGEIPCRYRYSDYVKEQELQDTINGLGLNKEAFWLLVMFCFDYAVSVCISGFTITDSAQAKIARLIKLIPDDEESEMQLTLKTPNGKIEITDNHTISILAEWIKQGYSKDKDSISGYKIGKTQDIFNPKSESNSVLIWYFASLLKYFFEINPQIKSAQLKSSKVSLNKNMLISKLIYFTRIATNDNFKYDTETLKGFFKQYKGKNIMPHSSVYPTC